jgi:hypothetical protein
MRGGSFNGPEATISGFRKGNLERTINHFYLPAVNMENPQSRRDMAAGPTKGPDRPPNLQKLSTTTFTTTRTSTTAIVEFAWAWFLEVPPLVDVRDFYRSNQKRVKPLPGNVKLWFPPWLSRGISQWIRKACGLSPKGKGGRMLNEHENIVVCRPGSLREHE